MTKNDTINRLNNPRLDDKSSLWIWALVQIKHLLKQLANLAYFTLW